MMKFWSNLTVAMLVAGATATAGHAAPIKVLLITGGCCHDYANQKDILKKGLEARLDIVVDQMHSPDKSTHPPLPLYGNPEYAKGYDLVIHDECAADIKDPAVIAGVLKPHKDGLPGVNLHCAMHCYRFGDYQKPVAVGAENAAWFEYTGLQTTGHGAQKPIAIHFEDTAHDVTKGLTDWTTINEELYNNIQLMPNLHSLAKGAQTTTGKDGKESTQNNVTVWVNTYGPNKARVFSTTIGHNNATVEDARYLDLVANGILWAVNRPDAKKK